MAYICNHNKVFDDIDTGNVKLAKVKGDLVERQGFLVELINIHNVSHSRQYKIAPQLLDYTRWTLLAFPYKPEFGQK